MPQAELPGGGVILNVAFLTAWYPTAEQPTSGVFVRDHARAAALHHRVVVIVPQLVGPGMDAEPAMPDDELATMRVRFRRSSLPLGTGIAYTRAVLGALNDLDRRGRSPDLIHAHVHEVGIAAIVAGRRRGIPVVLSEHSSRFSLDTLPAPARRRARLMSHGIDLICPVSEDLRRHMERIGMTGPFEVVPNPVDSDVFTPTRPPPSGPARALFVGGLHPVKRADLLLRAFARVDRRDLRLDVVGDGPCRGELERLSADLGLGSDVRFWGHQDREGVLERVRAAHFLVVPSAVETFGIAIVEALAVGRPVVATAVGAIPELVDRSRGRLVAAGDERALAEAITLMAGGWAAYDWRGLSDGVRAQFGLASIGVRWDGIYRSLTARGL